jgi:hypothetical protein
MMRLGHYRPVRVKSPAVQSMRTTLAVRMQKGIQAALTRRSDPSLTKLAPLSPTGKGADDPHPSLKKEVVILE